MAAAGRKALGMRYRLLPYLYTAFQQAAASGNPVARPLFWAYPHHWRAHEVEHQWLLSDAVLVSPVLNPGETEVCIPVDVPLACTIGVNLRIEAFVGDEMCSLASCISVAHCQTVLVVRCLSSGCGSCERCIFYCRGTGCLFRKKQAQSHHLLWHLKSQP